MTMPTIISSNARSSTTLGLRGCGPAGRLAIACAAVPCGLATLFITIALLDPMGALRLAGALTA